VTYSVKEIYYTLQGEGVQTGRPAVFCRFAGCNLWSGREQDRATAICKFCDTAFVGVDGVGGGKHANADTLADAIMAKWPDGTRSGRFVVMTGGEPALQVDSALITALHDRAFLIAIETNGTVSLCEGIDWICVSPKADTDVIVRKGNELKLVFPQEQANPESFASWAFDHFFLSPMDGPYRERFTRMAIDYCLRQPKWRLNVQTHKLIGIP
jgi:7-carboxy-7-deazaguanine synthase